MRSRRIIRNGNNNDENNNTSFGFKIFRVVSTFSVIFLIFFITIQHFLFSSSSLSSLSSSSSSSSNSINDNSNNIASSSSTNIATLTKSFLALHNNYNTNNNVTKISTSKIINSQGKSYNNLNYTFRTPPVPIRTYTPKIEKPKVLVPTLNSVSKDTKSNNNKSNNKNNNKNNKYKDTEKVKGKEMQTVNSILSEHPQISPRPGTDISENNRNEILKCPNQSKCIIPELQLQPKLKIYLCKHPVRQGVRFYFLTREGLLLHPNVELVSYNSINTADFIVYLPGSAPWHRTECNSTNLADKLIVLDEFDGHQAFAPTGDRKILQKNYDKSNVRALGQWYYMMFKRSYVVRKRGHFKYFPHLDKPDMYPMTYSLAEAYLRGPFSFAKDRKWEIVCTLRGSRQQPARLRVQDWLKEYVENRKIPEDKVVTGQINRASRTTVSKQYFELMHGAQIIVTVNPSDWEGDFRLWEALASGALVFVDPIFAPHPYPLKHEENVIFFSNSNKTDLWTKLDYYRKHTNKARTIAINGYLHSMKYHRTVGMMDYVLRSAHAKSLKINGNKGNYNKDYLYTAQTLLWQTKEQAKHITKTKTPGNYPPIPYESVHG